MAVPAGMVKKLIAIGVFKVLYGSNPNWEDIKDQEIWRLFVSVANPTDWDTFFVEAVGTAIQQELVLRGNYCPQLEETLVTYESDGSTWADLDQFIRANKRNSQASF